MQITREQRDKHSIQGYSETEIKINSVVYTQNLWVSRETINADWRPQTIRELNVAILEPLLVLQPEVIVIGHNTGGAQPPVEVLQHLSKLKIGLECMNIGAASRTFNILLSEGRAVALGIIF
ncbi:MULTISPECIES: Mth938-like domain-containing protein [Legionella]|uniref:Xcc1710-like domain-containing protein n=1 Tax=Legionella septentrionalis TaxID=2498109 RepID=A0A3S0VNU5_9GAMM|nr:MULTISPECIES: MTH938/NDUFAF3 family protein [Legionella]MCP0913489.1 MTH938/NDUFAF3 family protein [Legionella sp. 27cVA30]RUQ89735.1 hypothetical protein EKM59_02965 [Legionella septentrionalis]RUQ99720.1 hypothetical protein ELY11_03840 [Legionella septentrionalis]RUR11086.1 hypothetical protein ELY14_03185 [Legionella septentrionalis]RUR15248.1 hypothetical protein ELY10_06490 [Legionella septentrionalis]